MKSYKYYSCLFIFIVAIMQVQAQTHRNAITISPYNESDVGRFMSVEYSRTLKNDFNLSLGLLIHMNIDPRNPDRHDERYLNGRFWAYNNREGIGLTLGIQKNVYCFLDKKVNLFAYGQTMIRYMGARSLHYTPIDTVEVFDSISNKYLQYENSREIRTDIRNLFSVESITGVGINAKINKRLSFYMKFGIGINIIANTPKEYLNTNLVVEHAIQKSFGLYYSF